MLPTTTLRPGLIGFWALNDASSVQEKIEYMRTCRASGIEGLCMMSRCGNMVPYCSDEWFEMIRQLVEEGRRLEMDMWLYDEDPCPSGAAAGWVMRERPELCARYLAWHEKPGDLKPGQLWSIGESKVVWAGLVPVEEPLDAVEMTGGVGLLRRDWAMGEWDSRYYYPDTPVFPCPRAHALRPRFTMRVPEVPEGYMLAALSAEIEKEEGGAWGNVPDTLNYETFELFKRLTLDRYLECVGQYFGSTIPCIFTDEAKPAGNTPITKDLFEGFQKTYGYDLRPRLYQLFGEPLSEQHVQTRLDYRRWVTARFLDAFMAPYRRWCDAHGLYLAGHISPEDDPIQEAITVGSVMPLMKQQSLPGCDIIIPFTGNSRAPALNLGSLRVGSLKSQHARPYAVSESLAVSDWTITSQKSRQILTWQKVLGLDRFVVHAFFTGNEGVQNYEAPPDYGPYSSIFKGMCVVNDWLKALDGVMDGATHRAEVAVLSSLTPFWASRPDAELPSLRRMRSSLWFTILACLRAHVGLHVVSEEDLSEAKVRNGRVVVGQCTYSSVLVPGFDVLGADAFAVLRSAAEKGASVFWFDGGPTRVVGSDYRLEPSPPVPGEVLRQRDPSVAWCRRHFEAQAAVTGQNKEECYLRRMRSPDGEEYLLATNVSEAELTLNLGAEGDRSWIPVRVDGEAHADPKRTSWRLPPCGSGLFRLGAPPEAGARPVETARRRAGEDRTFERLGVNLLRLTRCTVTRPGKAPVELDHPRPYWQVFNDFSARRIWPMFLGEVPVESTVPEGDLRYGFTFAVRGRVKTPRLVLDPRCARGRFRVFLNGKQIGRWHTFPLVRTRALRVSLRGLKGGANTVEVRFQAESAMEGLLSQLYVEGDFDVDIEKAAATISPVSGRVSQNGWQEAGLPHYMGEGLYRWQERFGPEEMQRSWSLEVERVVDSAELRVNGESVGGRAWPPWRWPLSHLKEGANTFELVVSGTAGNKHGLAWPNQAQGWIGGAWLVATERKDRPHSQG